VQDNSPWSEKRAFKGKTNIHEILSRIQFVHRKVEALRQELGSGVFDKLLNEIKEKVEVTFTSVTKGGVE
jgi:hypothetical protein